MTLEKYLFSLILVVSLALPPSNSRHKPHRKNHQNEIGKVFVFTHSGGFISAATFKTKRRKTHKKRQNDFGKVFVFIHSGGFIGAATFESTNTTHAEKTTRVTLEKYLPSLILVVSIVLPPSNSRHKSQRTKHHNDLGTYLRSLILVVSFALSSQIMCCFQWLYLYIYIYTYV